MPDTPAYCTYRPAPGTVATARLLSGACPDCGHAVLLHIGVDHCPVCELTDLNAQTWHEKLLSGQKSINDHRRALGMPPPDPEPEVGATVHYLRAAPAGNLYCVPASVGGIQTNGTLNLDMPPGTTGRAFVDAVNNDPSARSASTWHYPCDKAEPDPAPEPDGPPTTITINVTGTIDGRQLVDTVEREMLRRAKRNPQTYAPYKR